MKTDDVPEWAIECALDRACERSPDTRKYWKAYMVLRDSDDAFPAAILMVARYIAAHEPAPVDPLRDLAVVLARESQDLTLALSARADWFEAKLRARGVTMQPNEGEG